MERVLYLEPDEEITSVIDRIKKLKAKNIALVIPRDAVVLQSVINLKLLQKEAEKLKKELAVVTSDRVGRNLASQVGLATFDKLEKEFLEAEKPELPINEYKIPEDAQKFSEGELSDKQEKLPREAEKEISSQPAEEKSSKPFEKSKIAEAPKSVEHHTNLEKEIIPKKKKMKLNKKLLIIGGIVSVFVAAFLAFLYLPKANITIQVKATKFSANFDYTVDKAVVIVDATKNTIPGVSVQTTSSKDGTVQSTGQLDTGAKATGTVKVYNSYDSGAQLISAGAIFTSSGKTFTANSKTTVPGFTLQAGNPVPGTANVAVTATQTGDSYNIPAGKFTIAGYPADKFYGQTTSAMAGGFTKVVTVVSQKDVDTLKTTLTVQATTDAVNQLKTKVGKDITLLDNSSITTVTDFTTSAKLNDQVASFTGKITITATALDYKNADFKKLASANFTKSMPTSGQELVQIDYANMKKDIKSNDGSKMVVTATGDGFAGPKLDLDKLKTNLIGKDQIRADEYLTSFVEIKSDQISFWPLWVKKVPSVKKRVNINVQYIADTTAPTTTMPTTTK